MTLWAVASMWATSWAICRLPVNMRCVVMICVKNLWTICVLSCKIKDGAVLILR